jgi:elongator complex protein 3
MKKFSRTASGVTPVAVMAEPIGCPGECIYCPTYAEAPKSYTPDSPAAIRAIKYNYEAGTQVTERVRTLSEMGHAVDKIELIIMGGTFLSYPADYQYQFVKDCYDALNGNVSSSLEEAKKNNENSIHRCIGLCIETRPDWCGERQILNMLEYGTTRVEVGVQILDDDIYRLVKRGHKVADVITATRLLRQYGLKVHYHWMPGLPGSSPEHDLDLTRELFSNDDFKPDGLKLYPTVVVAGTELENWYNNGTYKPYTVDQLIKLLSEIKAAVPGYVRISRIMRDLPTKFIVAGCKDLALRSTVRKHMDEIDRSCKCIRCREYGHRAKDGWKFGEPQLKRLDYQAAGGNEIFLTMEDEQETIFGLLRLRINGDYPSGGYKAIVREIHVYGSEVPLGEKKTDAIQHKGLGGKLLQEAEKISLQEFNVEKLAIISGVGARDYFRKEFGYEIEGAYMTRKLKN